VTTLEQKPTTIPASAEPAGGARALPFRPHVIRAVFQRNILSYFYNPAGYVFIALFVLVSSLVAFYQAKFFTNNLANLAPLNELMPYVLLFFIPAVTMSIWSEERKQGTDELLFTLPAHDIEIVLGKYFAALGIYTVALLFSLPFVVILFLLGRPDLGVMFSTYFGYWLMGVMLIALGMVASLLSSNATVAFILGGLFAGVPVLLSQLSAPLGPVLHRQLSELSVPAQFEDFGTGVITMSGVLYFVSFAVAMLYVNMVLVGRRHWAGGAQSWDRGGHAVIRIGALLLALCSFNALVGRLGAGARADVTAERLHTLSAQSIALIRQIPKDRPVYIQAYYSPEVPRDYVQSKSDLIGLLREYAARGGSRVHLNLVQTELYSPEARDAEKRFGIEPRRVLVTDEAKQESAEIFLGVAFTSGLEEVVIPFFDRGLPIEYELTRSIRVVSRSNRKKIGILNTDAKLMGGFDFRSMGQNPEWSIVSELKKQYDVDSVAPDVPVPSDVDVLLVAQPSSLTQPQIDNLTAYIRKGGSTLLFLDPLPYENPQISPDVPKQPPGGMFGGGPPPEPKGDLRPLLDMIGLEWPTEDIVWNPYNPHLQLAELPPEFVFIHRGKGAADDDAFNEKQLATSGLQEVVLLFSGQLRARGASPEFTPLLRTNDSGGTVAWRNLVQQSFMGISGINPRVPHFASGKAYTLAARLQGQPATDEAPKDVPAKKAEEKKDQPAAKKADIHVIAIADLDLISEQFFELRRRKIENLELDNVTFVLNCVDVLAGDGSFVALRKQRPQHRTLERLEAQYRTLMEQRQVESKAAEDAADEQLKVAQKRLDKKVEEVRARRDMDERTKEIMLMNLQDVENRRLEVEKANIDDQKRQKLQDSKAEYELKNRRIQNQVRAEAMIPPVLPLAVGAGVFFLRRKRENQGANPNRLL
jgi:ABC-2 type transport system permease protein